MNEFNPCRIQVLIHGDKPNYGKPKYTYQVVIRDMTVTGSKSIIDHWRTGWRDTPSGWEASHQEGGLYLAIHARKKAIKLAGRLASEYGYTFSPSADVVQAAEIIHGPEQVCLSCGLATGRGFVPTICRTCQGDITRGAAVRQSDDTQIVVIEPDRVTGLGGFSHFRDDSVVALQDALPFVFGAPLEPMDFGLKRDKSRFEFVSSAWRMAQEEKRSYFEAHTGMRVIRLPRNQVAGLKMLAELFQKVRDHAYEQGKRHGEGMLVKIATGELTIEQLQAKY